MTTDETLAELRAQYPDWEIEWFQLISVGGYTNGDRVTARRVVLERPTSWHRDLYDYVEMERADRDTALAALAEALAKLGGVTVPRKVALALGLVAAGRWSRMYALERLMEHWFDVQSEDLGEEIFKILGVTEDEAFEEMKPEVEPQSERGE